MSLKRILLVDVKITHHTDEYEYISSVSHLLSYLCGLIFEKKYWMQTEEIDVEEVRVGKQLYEYQELALQEIFERLKVIPAKHNILFQLPTGGGKTVIFSEIARRYIAENKKRVLILTHRIELARQTSKMLEEFKVRNKIINSEVKELGPEDDQMCFVAMVETLNNRFLDKKIEIKNLGIIIVDEDHYNSFRKLFKYFENCNILGVTATPLSSNIKLPMHDNYNELLQGASISDLIKQQFLAQATTYSYDVHLGSLKIGINGDYTVSSSERLYSTEGMQSKLLRAYKERCIGTKTLIFNNGINTSKEVYNTFVKAGYDIRHLDSKMGTKDREAALLWFKTKPDAILTSVGILTTGFDEPSIGSIIINRATKSLTLYHQMIGRGSRITGSKKSFTVIDLGNNAARFGLWEAPIDWMRIFKSPHYYYDSLVTDEDIERHFKYVMPDELKAMFSKTKDLTFDMKENYKEVNRLGLKSIVAIERSIDQHAQMCIDNADTFIDAIHLKNYLRHDIEYRINKYTHCTAKTTKNYVAWLMEDYDRKLRLRIDQAF